jgi:CBS domain containing-hemolysin-like protein
LETQTEPYPSTHAVDHLQALQIDQLFVYIGIAILAIILLAIMAAAEKAFLLIREKDIAELKKSDEAKDQKLLNLIDEPIRLQAVFSIVITFLTVFIAIIFNSILHHYLQAYLSFDVEVIIYSLLISLALVKLATFIPGIYSSKHYLIFAKWCLGLIVFFNWILKPLIKLYFFAYKAE